MRLAARGVAQAPGLLKGKYRSQGWEGMGIQEAEPPRSALTSRGGPGGGGSSRRQFAPVQSSACSGSGVGVGSKAEEGMEG